MGSLGYTRAVRMGDTASAAECVWVITGVPGAGKTTSARRLAERLPRSAVIEGDAVSEMVVAGHVRPEDEPAEEAERQLDLSVTNQALLARSFFDAGFTPVIDWIVTTTGRLARYRRTLGAVPVRFVVLAPGETVSVARHRARRKHVAERWVHMHDAFDRVRGVGLWIDNSELSVDDTVAVMLREWRDGDLGSAYLGNDPPSEIQ